MKVSLARYFNHVVQSDGFVLFGEQWQLLIDECFRYKAVDFMPTKTFADCFQFLMENWLRIFGPMGFFFIDQESAFAGNEMASVCDKFGIVRAVTGSDPANTRIQSKHTSTGLC